MAADAGIEISGCAQARARHFLRPSNRRRGRRTIAALSEAVGPEGRTVCFRAGLEFRNRSRDAQQLLSIWRLDHRSGVAPRRLPRNCGPYRLRPRIKRVASQRLPPLKSVGGRGHRVWMPCKAVSAPCGFHRGGQRREYGSCDSHERGASFWFRSQRRSTSISRRARCRWSSKASGHKIRF